MFQKGILFVSIVFAVVFSVIGTEALLGSIGLAWLACGYGIALGYFLIFEKGGVL